MAPSRKGDPGVRFDWRRLALQGLSIWPSAMGDADRALSHSLAAIGYPDAGTQAALDAFRLRFRPFAKGNETAQDRALADQVARMMI